MPTRNITVDLAAQLVLVKDVNCVACSSCPELLFQSMCRALLHSLKHRGRCANCYPMKDNENSIVDCCPNIATHETCLDLAIYGAVVVVRMEIVDNEIELRLKCNFKQENPDNQKQPLNKPCNEEFDNITSYNHHVGLKHCQFLPKKRNGDNTSKYLSIQTIVYKLKTDDNFGEIVIYNFASTAWIKQPELLYSKQRAKEIKWQLNLSNLLSDKTWQNRIFVSQVLGFDLELLRREARESEKDHSQCNKKISSWIIGNWIRNLLPAVDTVEFHCYIYP